MPPPVTRSVSPVSDAFTPVIHAVRQFARRLLWLEPVVVGVCLYIFWIETPPVRFWALALLLPFPLLRWLAYRRFFTTLPITLLFALFIGLAILNVFSAPFSWGQATLTSPALGIRETIPYGWLMLGRPLLGMALFFALVEHARVYGIRGVIGITVILGLIVAYMALVATQWNSKSAQLRPIIDLLPVRWDHAFTRNGFNANELAGGLAWLAPVCAGFAVYRWKPRLLQFGALLAFALLLLALFLGQSRFALGGVIVALGALVILLLRGRGRWLALAGLALLVLLQAGVMLHVFNPNTAAIETLAERDENSANRRLEMWGAAINVVRDHPLTGVGMNLFRNSAVRAVYPVTTYKDRVLPHAHNEFFQIAADMGLPGLFVFAGLYVMVGLMTWRCWQTGDPQVRAVSVAAAAGLVAHAIYGMGDAIALWDRFSPVFWWLIGVAGAQYVLIRQPRAEAAAEKQI